MKLTLILLVLLCGVFVGCGSPKAPSGEQIQTALGSAVKKENPDATAKLTNIEMGKDGKAVNFKFACTNCVLEDATRVKKTVPSANGEGVAWLDPQDGKWKIQQATVDNEDGTKHTISSLTGQIF